MHIMIRSITESDVSEIHAVALAAWRYTYRNLFDEQFIEHFVNRNYAPERILSLFSLLQAGTMYFNVAEHDSRIVGFCNIGIDGQMAELYRIYLLPAYIGQGLGQRLLERGEEFVREQDINTYFCFVHKDNELGKRFYLRSGFQHLPEKDHEDEWYMQKKLISSQDHIYMDFELNRFQQEHYTEYASWFADPELNRHLGPIDQEWLDAVLSQPESAGVTWAVFRHRELVAVIETVLDPENQLPAAITAVAVKPSLRRQGIGTSLLGLILSLHKNQGILEHVAYISVDNMGGQRCVTRAGFVPVTSEPDERGYIEFCHLPPLGKEERHL